MSEQRDLMVAGVVQGMITSNAFGLTFGQDPVGACRFYSSQSVKLADAIIEKMATPVVPISPTKVIVEEEEIINK